jgi:hypothetical protein
MPNKETTEADKNTRVLVVLVATAIIAGMTLYARHHAGPHIEQATSFEIGPPANITPTP